MRTGTDKSHQSGRRRNTGEHTRCPPWASVSSERSKSSAGVVAWLGISQAVRSTVCFVLLRKLTTALSVWQALTTAEKLPNTSSNNEYKWYTLKVSLHIGGESCTAQQRYSIINGIVKYKMQQTQVCKTHVMLLIGIILQITK